MGPFLLLLWLEEAGAAVVAVVVVVKIGANQPSTAGVPAEEQSVRVPERPSGPSQAGFARLVDAVPFLHREMDTGPDRRQVVPYGVDERLPIRIE